MAANLHKVVLRHLLDTQDNDLYSRLESGYFTGMDRAIIERVNSFYKANARLPSADELAILRKDPGIDDYLSNYILIDENIVNIAPQFLISQLQDYYIRDETIRFLDKFIDNLDSFEKEEIFDQLEAHLLKLNAAIPYDEELFDVGELETYVDDGDFIIYPTGLAAEYDATNGGFALQELVLLGGRRGSGKSIISTNLSLNRFRQGSTVAFFSIEMRYKEVYSRVMSIISGVPFLDIFKNQTTATQKVQMAKAKAEWFYEDTEIMKNLIGDLEHTQKFKEFDTRIKVEKPKMKENRLFLIDKPDLTVSRIDHFCNTFKSKYPDFTLGTVDYLNIVKTPDQMDWKSQIAVANSLKLLARKHDITMLTPYQIDASGEARFAKGILDAADRGLNFFPPPENEDRQQDNKITMHTTKIRNGVHMSFDIWMDWECVKIDPNQSEKVSEKPHNAVMYGGSDNEGSMDI